MDIAEREVLEELILESQEHLATIEPDLLTLEGDPEQRSPELINRIFRGIHSIKGGFGFLGIETVQNLAHVMESVLMKVRDGELAPTSAMIDTLLDGVDKIQDMIADVEASSGVDATGVIADLQPWLDGTAPSPEPESAPAPVAPAASEAAPAKSSGFIPLGKPRARPQETEVAEVNEAEAAVEAAPPPPPPAPAPKDEKQAARQKSSDVLRVRLTLLDKLMNLAGELVLARNQIVQSLDRRLADTAAGQGMAQGMEVALADSRRRILASWTEQHHGNPPPGFAEALDREWARLRERILQEQPTRLSDLPGMNASMVNLDVVTTDLQEGIMQTRMQSMETLFGKLPRQVRELSRRTGKEVDLELSGSEVELDKSIIEALSDPLNHMIRNSLDHGLETPAERTEALKTAAGKLKVRAYHEGGQVNIEIADDGRGIDPAVIRSKALEKGVVSEDRAEHMDDREAVMLIMAPGFSTAKEVSDISGRGVGMDVVRSNIESLGGAVDVESRVGEGTRMTLKLPLTLAIIPSLMVQVGPRRFAVPQVSLDELVRVRRGDGEVRVESVQGRDVLRLRGKLLPLVRLSERLGLEAKKQTGGGGDAVSILVLKHGGSRYGLIVDGVLDSEEIVVKPLPGMLKDCRSYAGATILGDGGVAMILDVAGIAEEAGLRFSEADVAAADGDVSEGYIDRTESQSLLLFRNHPDERFALNLDLISRIEKIAAEDIDRIGDREYLTRDDRSLRLIRLHDFMPVQVPPPEQDELYVIIPKLVKHPLGIVTTACDDVTTSRAVVDREGRVGPGIMGSAVLDGELTVYLDVFSLFEAAEPEIYARKDEDGASRDLRVLLAEDTSFFRAMIKAYVESLGCGVTTARDGQEAWEILNDPGEAFDLLVTDIEMPRMNGMELTRKVRASQVLADLPVISLTSLVSDDVRRECLAAGVNAHEVKMDKETLAGTIAKVVKGGRADG